MENEAILQQFDEIEEKVERLIKVCKLFEATNLELKNKIEMLEKELQGKVEGERSYAEERGLIRSRIDSLLAKLEDSTEA